LSQIRQPGYPRNLGSVAFRPTITRGLALSAFILLVTEYAKVTPFQSKFITYRNSKYYKFYIRFINIRLGQKTVPNCAFIIQ
jgi:hypothetical protein